MRTFQKSHKLDNVCYDIRGPVMDEANRMIAQYSKYYPQTAEAFMYNFTDGQSYTVNCSGMTATTTVRTQK